MIGWNPDSFGYNWQLPQIYKRSGIDYFVTQKMTWNDTNKLPFRLFWWESPDGSKVLTYFPHDYANHNVDPMRLSADLATAAKRAPGMHDMMDLFGVGDHGGGPTRAMLDQGHHWMEPDKVGAHEEFGTALPYLQRIAEGSRPRLTHLELRLPRSRQHHTPRITCRRNQRSHLERRALPRISPRRLHHAGRPQAQHA